jgi:hypothetical protein
VRITPEIAAPWTATDCCWVSWAAIAVVASRPSQSPRLEVVIASHNRRKTGMRTSALSALSGGAGDGGGPAAACSSLTVLAVRSSVGLPRG